jgi:hypothetical protein
MRFEMRWLITAGWDGPEKILQYRYETEITDYGTQNPRTGSFLRTTGFTEWQTVPEIDEVWNADI